MDHVAPVEYTILNLDYHDLVPIRKGYVYMYDPEMKKWDVYRYQTEAGDENSVVGDPNTQEVVPAPNYSFTRYNVKTGQEKRWQVDVVSCSEKQGSFPYLLLREDATEVYVAYSEFRWPKALFKEIEKSNAFLDQFMTPVYPTQAKPHHRVDKLTKLPSFSSFFEKGQVKEEANEALVEENVIRYTARYIKSIKDIARNDLALERALFIALDDDVGNLLDVNMSVQNAYEYSLRFEEENAYALTTGRIVKQLKDKGVVSEDQWFEFGKGTDYAFLAELDDNFETDFKDVNDVSKALKKTIDILIAKCHPYLERAESSTYLTQQNTLVNFAESLGLENKSEVLAYMLLISKRAYEGLERSSSGKEYVYEILTGEKPERAPDDQVFYGDVYESDSAYTLFKLFKILEGVTGSQERGVDFNTNLFGALNSFFNTFADAVAKIYCFNKDEDPNEVSKAIKNTIRGLFRLKPRTLRNPSDAREMIAEILASTSSESKHQILGKAEEVAKIRAETGGGSTNKAFHKPYEVTQLEFISDASKKTSDLSKAFSDLNVSGQLSNGLGLLGGLITIAINGPKIGEKYRSSNAYVAFTQSAATQIAGGFLDCIAGYYSIIDNKGRYLKLAKMSHKIIPRITRHIGKKGGLKTAFKRAVVTARVHIGMTGAFIIASSIVTSALALGSAIVGWKNRDLAEFIGNGLWAVSGICFAAGLFFTPLLVLGFLCFVFGFITQFFVKTDIEKWVYNGFWGTSYKLGYSIRDDYGEDLKSRIDFSAKLYDLKEEYKKESDIPSAEPENPKKIEYKKNVNLAYNLYDKFNKEIAEFENLISRIDLFDLAIWDREVSAFSLHFKDESCLKDIRVIVNAVTFGSHFNQEDEMCKVEYNHIMNVRFSLPYEVLFYSEGRVDIKIQGFDTYKERFERNNTTHIVFTVSYEDEEVSKSGETKILLSEI